jgi:hypothetical protein
MPAGSSIAYQGGRLLVAVGSALIYSEPFTPGLRDESRGFEIFPAPITCIAAVEAGVFVMADKTYFLAGGLPAQSMRAVLPYGALQQQAGYRLAATGGTDGAHWMSTRGIVSARPTGRWPTCRPSTSPWRPRRGRNAVPRGRRHARHRGHPLSTCTGRRGPMPRPGSLERTSHEPPTTPPCGFVYDLALRRRADGALVHRERLHNRVPGEGLDLIANACFKGSGHAGQPVHRAAGPAPMCPTAPRRRPRCPRW